MKNLIKLSIIFLFASSLSTVSAQILEPVKWTYSVGKVSADEFDLFFHATIETNWHLYSIDVPDNGPIPTSFRFNESDLFEKIGKLVEVTTPYEKFDPSFSMNIKMFDGKADFRQRIRVLSNEKVFITGTLEFMSCDDSRCTPPQEIDFRFEVQKNINTADPEPKTTVVAEEVTPAVTTEDIDQESPIRETIELESETGSDTRSLWIFFFIAFAAGLAGLLTPCVFPMIPMTVTFFMQKQGNRLNAIINALIFGISIIAIYTGLGLLVSLTSVGAGFANQLSTHWIPNLLFFLLFVAFAASFFGLFEIVLPGNLASKTDQQADKGGYLGSFFMAVTLVIVSLSCVGPIIGALLVEAAGGLALKPILGMFGFSLAFALPFTLFAIFPSWLKNLPKSGGWLNSVKIVLGFIVLAFSLKFLLSIDQVYQFGILSRDVYLAIWIVLFTLLGLYLLGKIKFSNDSDIPYLSVPRLFLVIVVFSFVVYLIPGMFGAPLKGLSSMLPAKSTHSFDLQTMIKSGGPGVAILPADAQLCETPKYADFLSLPHGLTGYFDLQQGLDCARKQNKPVFLDFVGHACSNCKVMEARVWSDPRVLEILRNDYVIIALYVDDRTTLPEGEWVVSEFDGKEKRRMGQKNLDYQIVNFNTNTQPMYALVDHDENLLTQPRGFDLNIEAFIRFLEEGKKEFAKRNQ
jgi:thiol:disulfide interchange protein